MIKLEDIARAIKRGNDFLITTHIRADGDGISSILAMSDFLKQLQKRHFILINEDYLDPHYKYLNYENYDIYFLPGLKQLPFENKWSIVLDAPSLNRIGGVSKYVNDLSHTICIDHHKKENTVGFYEIFFVNYSSTCEILYDLGKILGIEFNKSLAEKLYTGIIFDTGRFRFVNAKPKTFQTAGELVSYGIDIQYISDKVFGERTYNSLKILGYLLLNMEFYKDSGLAVMTLPYEQFTNNGKKWEDLEGFLDYPISIKDVEVAVFFKELAKNDIKVSLRSKNYIPVIKFAEKYSGGGHFKAAGFRIKGELEKVKKRIIKDLIEFIKEQIYSKY